MTAPRRFTRASLVLLVSALALYGACSGSNASDQPAAEVPEVNLRPDNVAVAAAREISSGPSISGTLAAIRDATLRAEVAGIVTGTAVEEGQQVQAGQVLVRLDDSAIRDAVLSARSSQRTANEAVVVAKRNAERAERLTQAGAMAERDLEQARWTAMNAEAGLADATARLSSAEKQLAKTVVRAPFAGVVSERPVNAGDVVQVGNPVATVVDPRSLRLEATVPVSALTVLKVGTSVDFEVSGYEGKRYTGRVERINPMLDPATRQVRIHVAIPNVTGRLVAGLFAQGRVAIDQRTALAVPISALDLKTPTPSVRRLRGGRVELVAVELGLQDDVMQVVEIKAGLAAGDTVLVGPAAAVAVGTPVRIVKE
jgi:membrane fusion protein, multidrug efflux system